LEVNLVSSGLDSVEVEAAAKEIPLRNSQHRLQELGAQHRTGSVIDLAWHPENSQEVLELLLQEEAYSVVVRMEGFEVVVAGTVVLVLVAVVVAVGSSEDLEGIDQREGELRLVVHKRRQKGDRSRGHQSSCDPQPQSSNPATARQYEFVPCIVEEVVGLVLYRLALD